MAHTIEKDVTVQKGRPKARLPDIAIAMLSAIAVRDAIGNKRLRTDSALEQIEQACYKYVDAQKQNDQLHKDEKQH